MVQQYSCISKLNFVNKASFARIVLCAVVKLFGVHCDLCGEKPQGAVSIRQ